MAACIFCRIIAGQAPAKVYYRDEQVIAFQDIHPVAPVHILIVPIKHLESINAMTEEDKPLIGHLFWVARQLAAQQGIAQSGYRSIINTGPDSGQAVFHLHLHLIGGQRVRFPMG
ncbi:MAG: histidine triad nucleotide-binding protein [Anaerolineae bacterium]|jgi:histidine triad (HIT) family protein|nr:MAG: histidine triad nucleotide-binding protein [Anaerolineae bacterium]